MKRCGFRLALAAAAALSAAAGQGSQPPGTLALAPQLEDYLAKQQLKQFVEDAGAFLRSQPSHPLAARVAMDLHMLGTLTRDGRLARQARLLLLLRYPGSLFGAYVMQGVPDAKTYRRILQEPLRDKVEELAGPFGEAFRAALTRGLKRYGPSLLADDGFALCCAVAARQWSDGELQAAADAHLDSAKEDQTLRKLREIALDGKRSAKDKAVALHRLGDDPSARLLVRYFLSMLSAEDRDNEQMLLICAETLLGDRKFAQAEQAVAKLAARRETARRMFWLGWCRFAQGRFDAAADALAKAGRMDPSGPWAAPAEQLRAACGQLDERLGRLAADAMAAIAKLRDETDAFEGQAVISAGGEAAQLYVAVVPGDDYAEIHYRRGGATLVALRSVPAGAKLYLSADATTYEFAGMGMVPVAKLALRDDGVSAAFGLERSVRQALKAGAGVLDSPFLSSAAGMKRFLVGSLIRRGIFPGPVSTDGSATTHVWLSPSVREAKLSEFRATLDADKRLVGLRYGAFRVERLRYGAKSAAPLSPPPWPAGKTVSVSKDTAPSTFLALVGKALGEVTHLFGGK